MPHFASEHWPETDSWVVFIPAATSPSLPVTGVKVYVFQDHTLLLAKVDRGWDLPGGHLESGETPAQALVRELWEETGASVKTFSLIGYLKIVNEQPNEHSQKYPKESCILIYKGYEASFDQSHTFPSLEATDARFVPVNQLPTYHHAWNEAKEQVVAYAAGYRP